MSQSLSPTDPYVLHSATQDFTPSGFTPAGSTLWWETNLGTIARNGNLGRVTAPGSDGTGTVRATTPVWSGSGWTIALNGDATLNTNSGDQYLTPSVYLTNTGDYVRFYPNTSVYYYIYGTGLAFYIYNGISVESGEGANSLTYSGTDEIKLVRRSDGKLDIYKNNTFVCTSVNGVSSGNISFLPIGLGSTTPVGAVAKRPYYSSGIAEEATQTFEVVASVPDSTPPSDVTGLTITPTGPSAAFFDWDDATDNIGVTNYKFQIAYDSGFTSLGYNSDIGFSTSSKTFTGFVAGTIYYCRCKAKDAAGNYSTNWSSVVSFSITVYTLTAGQGSFVLNGQNANLLANRVLPANQGSFALSGQDASLTKSRVFSVDTGYFNLSGQAANLTYRQIPQGKFFPLEISSLAARPMYSTTVSTGKSGREIRDANWDTSLRKYDAKSAVKCFDHARKLIKFFHTCKGQWKAFLLKDYTDFQYDWTPCALTGNGSRTAFQMRESYTDDYGDIEYRNIKHPKRGTIRVRVSGTEKALGTDFSVDTNTGIITFTAAPANGAIIEQLCEFYVYCRFASDELPSIEFFAYWISLSGEEKGLANLESIPLIEVRE